MADTVRHIFFGSRTVLFLALFYVMAKVALIAWPASFWFDVNHIYVNDAVQGEEIVLAVDREINRPFFAEWAVLVRKLDVSQFRVYCTAHGQGDYRPDASFPEPLTLDWWSSEECADLQPGKYFITTSWNIRGYNGFPDKIVSVESNVFEVR